MIIFVVKTKLPCRGPCFIQALRAVPAAVLAAGQIPPLDGQMLSLRAPWKNHVSVNLSRDETSITQSSQWDLKCPAASQQQEQGQIILIICTSEVSLNI